MKQILYDVFLSIVGISIGVALIWTHHENGKLLVLGAVIIAFAGLSFLEHVAKLFKEIFLKPSRSS